MTTHTLKEAIVRLRNRLIQVQDLYEICLERSRQSTGLNIYTSIKDDDCVAHRLKESQSNYDKGNPRSLEGIPIAFKDNFCTKGVPTTCASSMLQNYIPPYDASMVSRCLDHGALLMGKTNMDEFAMGAGSVDSEYGPVKNPWHFVMSQHSKNNNGLHSHSDSEMTKDEDWVIAGGSSGGSAAAVAAGTCLAAFGSETGGSVRVPASFCGVVGLKPTYGLLSRHGLIPLCNSLDTPGIFARTVEDCAIVLNAVSGHDVKDSTTVPESHGPFIVDKELDIRGVHIGIPKESFAPYMDNEVSSLWQKMSDHLENCGAKVSQVSLPHWKYGQSCYSVVVACEIASNFARYDGIQFGLRTGNEDSTEELYAQTRLAGFNEVVRGRIMAGNFYLLKRNYESYFVQAQKVRRLVSDDFKKVFSNGVDFLLTPTTISDAPDFRWYSEESNMERCQMMDVLTSPANLAGIPATSIPAGLSERGLPLGLQLIGPMFSESKLLSVSHWIERESQGVGSESARLS